MPDLERLRKPGTSVPSATVVLDSEVSASRSDIEATHRVSELIAGKRTTSALAFAGRWLAVDLDDTLLVGSFTNQASWGALGNARPSIDQTALTTDWLATLKSTLRGNPKRIPSITHHPFLTNPPVEVAFRPALLEGLKALKAAGLGLVLVTASARQRVNFLRRRFPELDELFAGERGHLVAAEDLARAAVEAENSPAGIDHPPSLEAHQLRPRSIAAKTPWAISYITGLPHYDLLIDDSTTTAELFVTAGLADKLLYIHGEYPWSNYGSIILDTVVDQLLSKAPSPSSHTRLPCPKGALSLPGNLPPPTKVEDPYYYPLLHYKDQF